jgi:hypothetical protein
MNTRILAAFRGPVECRYCTGTVNFVLRGVGRDSGEPIEVLFSGASLARPGTALRDVEVLELIDERAHRLWQIKADGLHFDVVARSLQVHRAARDFLRTVRPPRVPLRVRLGWAALLWALRIPGVAAVAQRWRART